MDEEICDGCLVSIFFGASVEGLTVETGEQKAGYFWVYQDNYVLVRAKTLVCPRVQVVRHVSSEIGG